MVILGNADETRFLNVDLDIRSHSSLEPLAAAMGKKVSVLYVGRERRYYKAYLELHQIAQSDSTIRGFCALIRKMPKAERKLWDNAIIREFNIGMQARMKPITFEITIGEAAL
jgi:hypothetical protein